MDAQDKAKIESIIKDRKTAHGLHISRDSKVYKAFLDMERAAYSSGALERKVKEFIAVGISVLIDCESCIEWHIHEALLAGASEEQILEAIDVAIEMGGGPATVSSRFALKVLEYYSKGEH